MKRVYDEPARSDGTRVLVDRLWPRRLTKERAAVDAMAARLDQSDDCASGSMGAPRMDELFVGAISKN